MKKQNALLITLSAGLLSLGMASSADAALLSRLGGQAYYDDVANLTWLANANYAQTSGYDADGRMSWQAANDWAAQLTVGGVSGWRLADTLQPDASCNSQSGGESYGYNCTGSEMGDLFYNALGNTAGSLTNTGPFSNVQSFFYWSATESTSDTSLVWNFLMLDGSQHVNGKNGSLYSWAVQSGDVSAVPVPAAAWLFGSGLLGLVGVAKRRSI